MYNHIIPKRGAQIQILMTENANRVGHWICTFYNDGASHVKGSENVNRAINIIDNFHYHCSHCLGLSAASLERDFFTLNNRKTQNETGKLVFYFYYFVCGYRGFVLFHRFHHEEKLF